MRWCFLVITKHDLHREAQKMREKFALKSSVKHSKFVEKRCALTNQIFGPLFVRQEMIGSDPRSNTRWRFCRDQDSHDLLYKVGKWNIEDTSYQADVNLNESPCVVLCVATCGSQSPDPKRILILVLWNVRWICWDPVICNLPRW